MTGRIPSRGSDQFVVRLPDGMRDRLKAEAEANKRSMNAEIVARLEESFLSRQIMKAAGAERGKPPPKEVMLEMVSIVYGMLDVMSDLKAKGELTKGNLEKALAHKHADRSPTQAD